eukprot:7157750-Prymnesium_polylepis.1
MRPAGERGGRSKPRRCDLWEGAAEQAAAGRERGRAAWGWGGRAGWHHGRRAGWRPIGGRASVRSLYRIAICIVITICVSRFEARDRPHQSRPQRTQRAREGGWGRTSDQLADAREELA